MTTRNITLPNRIFFTGVPGSRWSGIAQKLETLSGFNISDRNPEREYLHSQYTGHLGAYFGEGMELNSVLDIDYIDSAWKETSGCKIVKSHDWAYKLDKIKTKFPNDWIMLVYRSDISSYNWWHEAGVFAIKYPNYSSYKNSLQMLSMISEQNSLILKFGFEKNLKWDYFTETWVYDNFGQEISLEKKKWTDILVTIHR